MSVRVDSSLLFLSTLFAVIVFNVTGGGGKVYI